VKVPAEVEVGSTANRYQILGKLAVGGMAEIFLARGVNATGVERYCVLKRILRERATDAQFVRMFLDEAKLAARLQHPNIASVYDIGMLGDSYFFTMEYVHGETVRSLLHRAHQHRRPVPLACVLTIVAGTAAGLHHAHERNGNDGRPLGIVHRDISPSNLMVSYEGNVKIVDFGVAKAADRGVETRAGTVKGKISYLSPEQCRGAGVDRRSDLFSLGIVMWETLTGARLYRRTNDFENMTAIVHEPPPPPSSRRADVPRAIDDIVLRLLAKSVTDRFQTARDVVEAVEDASMRAGTILSTSAVSRFVHDLFGARPEPWLQVGSDIAPVRRMLASRPVVPEDLAHTTVDPVEAELAAVPDLHVATPIDDEPDSAPGSSEVETMQPTPVAAQSSAPVAVPPQRSRPVPAAAASPGSGPVPAAAISADPAPALDASAAAPPPAVTYPTLLGVAPPPPATAAVIPIRPALPPFAAEPAALPDSSIETVPRERVTLGATATTSPGGAFTPTLIGPPDAASVTPRHTTAPDARPVTPLPAPSPPTDATPSTGFEALDALGSPAARLATERDAPRSWPMSRFVMLGFRRRARQASTITEHRGSVAFTARLAPLVVLVLFGGVAAGAITGWFSARGDGDGSPAPPLVASASGSAASAAVPSEPPAAAPPPPPAATFSVDAAAAAAPEDQAAAAGDRPGAGADDRVRVRADDKASEIADDAADRASPAAPTPAPRAGHAGGASPGRRASADPPAKHAPPESTARHTRPTRSLAQHDDKDDAGVIRACKDSKPSAGTAVTCVHAACSRYMKALAQGWILAAPATSRVQLQAYCKRVANIDLQLLNCEADPRDCR
jgi:eukaryotic-like serine/threonine-protein kinase